MLRCAFITLKSRANVGQDPQTSPQDRSLRRERVV